MIESEVKTLIVYMPDLYGPNANNTILHETLKNVVQNKKANFYQKSVRIVSTNMIRLTD
jgi:hypothetical protein